MQAIEFITKAKDGVIKIPQEYLDDIHGELRVIVLVRSHAVSTEKKKKLTALKLKTKDMKFDRDEANER
jgi:hypothetical protein